MSPALMRAFVAVMDGKIVELTHDEVQTNAVFWLQDNKYLLTACGGSLVLLALDGPDVGKSGEVATIASLVGAA